MIGAEIDLKQWGRLILVQPIRVESSSFINVEGTSALTLTGSGLRAGMVSGNGLPMVSFIVYNFKGKGTYAFPEPKGTVNEAVAMLGYGGGFSQGYYEPLSGKWIAGNVR
ncbi:hypothetical protein [Spirosoma fluminis]